MSSVMQPALPSAALLACLLCGVAAAHDLGTSPVHPVLDPLPKALRDVTVEVAETLAPQVLIDNGGQQVLTLLDEAGRPFARIGPDGLEADLNAAAWYKSVSTTGAPEPPSARDPHSPPRWTAISRAHSFGWFDPRLAVGPHAPSAQMRHADVAASTGTWRIPVRIGAADSEIAGHFEYVPPADGAYVTRLEVPHGFPSGIGLHVSPGAIPAILLLDPGHRDVTMIDSDGIDEVRIGGQGVSVNTASRIWRHWSQQERGSVDGEPGHWMTVSHGAAYSWLEPRGTTDAAGETHPEVRWVLPLRIGGRPYAVQGVAIWENTERVVSR